MSTTSPIATIQVVGIDHPLEMGIARSLGPLEITWELFRNKKKGENR